MVVPASGEPYILPGKANVRLARGDLVILESCGGGGYGAPPDAVPDGAPGEAPDRTDKE